MDMSFRFYVTNPVISFSLCMCVVQRGWYNPLSCEKRENIILIFFLVLDIYIKSLVIFLKETASSTF